MLAAFEPFDLVFALCFPITNGRTPLCLIRMVKHIYAGVKSKRLFAEELLTLVCSVTSNSKRNRKIDALSRGSTSANLLTALTEKNAGPNSSIEVSCLPNAKQAGIRLANPVTATAPQVHAHGRMPRRL